jgi:hypothetical protein
MHPESPPLFTLFLLLLLLLLLPSSSTTLLNLTLSYPPSHHTTSLFFHKSSFHPLLPLSSSSSAIPTYTHIIPPPPPPSPLTNPSHPQLSPLLSLTLFAPDGTPLHWVLSEHKIVDGAVAEKWLYVSMHDAENCADYPCGEWMSMSSHPGHLSSSVIDDRDVDVPLHAVSYIASLQYNYDEDDASDDAKGDASHGGGYYNAAVRQFNSGDVHGALQTLTTAGAGGGWGEEDGDGDDATAAAAAAAGKVDFVSRHFFSLLSFISPATPSSSYDTSYLPPSGMLKVLGMLPHCVGWMELCEITTSLQKKVHGKDAGAVSEARKQIKILITNYGLVGLAKDMVDQDGGICGIYGGLLNYDLIVPDIGAARSTLDTLTRELTNLIGVGRYVDSLSDPSCMPSLTLGLCYTGLRFRSVVELVNDSLRQFVIGAVVVAPAAERGKDGAVKNGVTVTRVGVISAHIHQSSICKAMCPLVIELASHDIHVTVLYPSTMKVDGVSKRVFGAVNATVELPGSLREQHELIGGLGLDVIIYLEVNYSPSTMMLPLSRLAPVQMATWGHHGTSGSEAIDYYVMARGMLGGDEEGFAEEYREQIMLVDVEGLGVVLDETVFDMRLEEGGEEEEEVEERVEWAKNSTVYLVAQSLPKFHPEFDEALFGILEKDTSALVVITSDTQKTVHLSTLRKRWLREYGKNLSERIVFVPNLPRMEMLTLLQSGRIHAALDPFPVGGGITTVELLSCGVGVVTFSEGISVIRSSAALVAQVQEGQEEGGEMVVHSVPEYIDAAVRIAEAGRRLRRKEGAVTGAGFGRKRWRNRLFDAEVNGRVVEEWRELIRRVVGRED